MLIDATAWQKYRHRRIGRVLLWGWAIELLIAAGVLIVGLTSSAIGTAIVGSFLLLLGIAGIFSETVTRRNLERQAEDIVKRLRGELPPQIGPMGSLPRIIDEVLENGSYETRNGVLFVGDASTLPYYEIRVTTKENEARRTPETAPITTIRRAPSNEESPEYPHAASNLFSDTAPLTPEEEAYRQGYQLGEISTRYAVSDTYQKEHRAGFDDAQRGRAPAVGQRGTMPQNAVTKQRRTALDRTMKEASEGLL